MKLELPAILKTTTARLSAMFLVLFALCAIVLVFYMSSLSARMLTEQTQETIIDEVQTLGRAYQGGGLPLLVRYIQARSRQPGANLYLLAEPTGRILSGNVEGLEPGVLEVEGWTRNPFSYRRYSEIAISSNDDVDESRQAPQPSHQAVALILRLPNQMILLVGRDLGEPAIIRDIVNRSLILAFGMMGVGALVIWYLVGRRALKRIDSVSDASKRIMGGDLTGRLPVNGSGDEFDRLSENLNVMLDKIVSLNDGLKQVSDNIAHDLKTPLTRLRNRAEVALAGKLTVTDYHSALEMTIAESDQLICTFNAILMISRLEAGYSAEKTEPVDLAEIVADVVELYEPAAEDVSVILRANIEGIAIVKANRELVAQALSNIVDNAIKYSTGMIKAPEVLVALSRKVNGFVLEIADNGPGIPKEELERVTDRFVRLEQSRSLPGSGLGLSLAKAVMEFHRGRLELSGRNPGLSVKMIFSGETDKDEQG